MSFWLVSDTHFGHDKIKEYEGRPDKFELKILNCLLDNMESKDTLIHLGDICIGNDEKWHENLCMVPGKKWLIRGNHDKKNIEWYLSHGWSSVCDYFVLNYFGNKILFSHKPIYDIPCNVNIHGHLHNNEHRKDELQVEYFLNVKQFICVGYIPCKLSKIIKSNKRSVK